MIFSRVNQRAYARVTGLIAAQRNGLSAPNETMVWFGFAVAIWLVSVCVLLAIGSSVRVVAMDLTRWLVAAIAIALAMRKVPMLTASRLYSRWVSTFLLFAGLPFLSKSRYEALLGVLGVSLVVLPVGWRLIRGERFVPRGSAAMVPVVLGMIALPLVHWRDANSGDRLAFALWLCLAVVLLTEVNLRVHVIFRAARASQINAGSELSRN